MQAVAQLGFGEGAEHFHTGMMEVGDTNYRHMYFLFLSIRKDSGFSPLCQILPEQP
jgi:hypothetical protein